MSEAVREAEAFEAVVAEAAKVHQIDPIKLRRVALSLASVSAFSPREAIRQVVVGLNKTIHRQGSADDPSPFPCSRRGEVR